MELKNALSILSAKFPDKKVYGTPVEYRGKYAFGIVDKDYVDGTPNWDSTVVAIDIDTGEISYLDAFDLDFMAEARPLEGEL